MCVPESTPTIVRSPDTAPARRSPRRAILIGGAAALIAIALLSLGGTDDTTTSTMTGGAPVLVLALPAFLAGMLSFLSPCCMPVLSAYFAYTFQARRERVVLMTVMFFLGLATTMVLLGASATALSQMLFRYLSTLTFVGGLVVIGFGVMSILGKGFAGIQVLDRPTASVASEVELAPIGAAHGQAHRVEIRPIDKRRPGAAAVIAAHEAVVVAEEHDVRIIGAEGERVKVAGSQRRDHAAPAARAATPQGEPHRDNCHQRQQESGDQDGLRYAASTRAPCRPATGAL